MQKKFRSWLLSNACVLALVLLLLFTAACKQGPLHSETAYVAIPQAVLRDRVAAIFNKVGTVSNGEKLEILDHQRRFVKVKTARGEQGWIEQRYLISEEVFQGFEKLTKDNASIPAQGRGVTRAELNMHLTPARDSEKLFQLAEGEKIDILKRTTAPKQTPGASGAKPAALSDKSRREPSKAGSSQPQLRTPARVQPTAALLSEASQPPPQPSVAPAAMEAKPEEPVPMDDWWLVRNKQGHVGWVLARMVDLDVPMEVAQYAEGQRIQACVILNQVQDEDKQVSQYLVLMSEPKDGMPFDFNSFRVFTWNLRRHRYETAYRERNILGFLPVKASTQSFDKGGVQPVFTLQLQNEDGKVSSHTFRLEGPLVKRVLAAGEEPQKLAQIHKQAKNKSKQAARHKAR